MAVFYFWNNEMPKHHYMVEKDSDEYFYKLLKKPDDRWSFITNDLDALRAYYQGIRKTFGYSIQPYYAKQGSNQVVVFVEFVYKNSPAAKAGLKRGDMFYKVNGQVLDDKNYQSLLSKDDMVIATARFESDGNITEINPNVSLTAVVMNTHPVIESKVIDVSGYKIGYLAYTSFLANYDTALVNSFKYFKTKNVTEMVLDLRYNGGGDIESALKLAGLLAPASAQGSIFIKEKWNNEMTIYYKQKYANNNDIFNLRIPVEEANLNLTRLFVLTTSETASASEMVIYGLAPYMQIVQVGEKTYGKYYGSVTLYDPEGKHNWAIQPIVMRAENSTNSINYSDGLPPTLSISDNIYNAQLGDNNEHFLAYALSKITTGAFPTPKLKSKSLTADKLLKFKDNIDPLRNIMLVEQFKR